MSQRATDILSIVVVGLAIGATGGIALGVLLKANIEGRQLTLRARVYCWSAWAMMPAFPVLVWWRGIG